MKTMSASLIILLTLILSSNAFVTSKLAFGARQSESKLAAATESGTSSDVLSLSLPKPLGMILEEVEEGASKGVFIKEVGEEGSASAYTDKILGAKLAYVQGEDVTALAFDDVMDKLINAPDTVELQLIAGGQKEEEDPFPVGTPVTIKVQQPGKDDLSIEAKVGDNLRQALLDNGFEVYQGMKQKLGNCGGGGQCTFCAMDFIESEGWQERSEYEDQKLKRNPMARLACLNNIQGPATITKADR